MHFLFWPAFIRQILHQFILVVTPSTDTLVPDTCWYWVIACSEFCSWLNSHEFFFFFTSYFKEEVFEKAA